MTPAELATLKTEITTDPLGRGYAAMDDESASKSLNKLIRTIDRESLSSGLLVSCLDKAEFTALVAADKAYLNLFITATEVPMTADVRQALRNMFPAGSKTRANINQATKRDGSRAEELGLGNVTPSDIADSKRL
jgi:hypothetical protein